MPRRLVATVAARVFSFAPAAAADAAVLVLGSMPGAASLRAAEYYAHPRNQFWPILGALVGAGPDLPYTERLRVMTSSGIALWDVLRCCARPGSLDAAIDRRSIVANDFEKFFAGHPRIRRVFFNGSMAESSYRRHVLPLLGRRGLDYVRLPSTSPAHAARSFEEKLSAWRVVVCGDSVSRRGAPVPPSRGPRQRAGQRG